jgi:hypothetical protein
MEMFELLRAHLLKSNPLVIKQEWKEIESEFPCGINAFDYINYSKGTFKLHEIPPLIKLESLITSTNLTSEFFEVFFFTIIVLWKKKVLKKPLLVLRTIK